MQDAWRAYLQLALGLTEASRKKAEQVARDLIGRGGATASQMQGMAEELVSTSRANREALAKLVRYEVDRTLGAVGLASADEVGELTERVRRLEHALREASARAEIAATAAKRAAEEAPAKEAPAKKAPAKKAPAKKAAKQAAGPPAKKAAKKAPAKKVAMKALAKKAATSGGTPAAERTGATHPDRTGTRRERG